MIPLGLPVLSLSIPFFSNSDQRLLFTAPRTDWPIFSLSDILRVRRKRCQLPLWGLVLLYCNLILIPFHRTDQLIYRRSLRLAVLLYFWKSNSANAPYLEQGLKSPIRLSRDFVGLRLRFCTSTELILSLSVLLTWVALLPPMSLVVRYN